MVTDPCENIVTNRGLKQVLLRLRPRSLRQPGFAGDHFAKAAFGPQPDIGPRGRSDQDMVEPAGSTRLIVSVLGIPHVREPAG